MDGGDRAAYMQIAKTADSVIITSTMAAASATGRNWAGFEVISSEAAVAAITAAGVTGSSLVSSASKIPGGTWVSGGQSGMSVIMISTKSTNHKVQAYNKILI